MNVTAETVQVGKHYHELRDAPKVKPFEVLSKDENILAITPEIQDEYPETGMITDLGCEPYDS
jgi:hypothetical protein